MYFFDGADGLAEAEGAAMTEFVPDGTPGSDGLDPKILDNKDLEGGFDSVL
jgi:hypothetical protein